ncbi:hypothetical protein ACROSR_18890 [Roseovarius tibetensis]
MFQDMYPKNPNMGIFSCLVGDAIRMVRADFSAISGSSASHRGGNGGELKKTLLLLDCYFMLRETVKHAYL